MSVTFVKGGTTVTLPDPAQRIPMTHHKRQTIARTQGGTVKVHDQGVDTYEIMLSFEMLVASEKVALQGFFHTTVDGAMNTFTYTDENSTSYTARFLEPDLVFTKIMHNFYDVSTKLELSAMPA